MKAPVAVKMPNFEFAAKKRTSGPISSTSLRTGLSCAFCAAMGVSIPQSYHGAGKIPRGEWRKIVHALADTDEMDGQSEFFSNRHQNAATRSPVELGHHQPGDACNLTENLYLTERVLADRRIEHK